MVRQIFGPQKGKKTLLVMQRMNGNKKQADLPI